MYLTYDNMTIENKPGQPAKVTIETTDFCNRDHHSGATIIALPEYYTHSQEVGVKRKNASKLKKMGISAIFHRKRLHSNGLYRCTMKRDGAEKVGYGYTKDYAFSAALYAHATDCNFTWEAWERCEKKEIVAD